MNDFNTFVNFMENNNNKLNKKVQVCAKYEEVKSESESGKDVNCSLFFSFYMNGELVNVGAFVSFFIDNSSREIKDIKLKNDKSPFLTDDSARYLDDEELKIISEKYIKPYFKDYILKNKIEYLSEKILDSINPIVFK